MHRFVGLTTVAKPALEQHRLESPVFHLLDAEPFFNGNGRSEGRALTEHHEDRLHADRTVGDMGSRQADGGEDSFHTPPCAE